MMHLDEIKMGKDLYTACTFLHAGQSLTRMLEKQPSQVFRSLRYGRRFIHDESRPALCLVSSTWGVFRNKAADQHIMTPACDTWPMFAEKVRTLSLLPRWADGWSATAEVLDELGYAIAESVAAMMCWGMEGDEGVIFHGDR